VIVHRAIAWSALGNRAEWLLAGFCAVCLAGMVALDATLAPIPFHFVYTAVTIMYGLRLWRLRGAITATLAVCVTTGGITLYNVLFSNEPAPELIEVPLMTMMVLATIWHVRSRQKAAAVVAAVADERQRMIERERTFFANVTHDLMTPITVARGHVDILGRTGTPTPEDLAETKQVIVEELKRIESMVGDLLLVGRLDEDHGLQKQPVDIEDLLDVVADRWSAVDDRVWSIDIDAPGTIPADGNTLAQALDNVIENAVSYTSAGDAITVRARAAGTTLTIEVIDSGAGIPEQALPHVFDRFYRADRGRSRATGGSGLGLAIVRDVVEAHGGTVAVFSPVAPGGGGTRLQINMPGYRRRTRPRAEARPGRSSAAG
jgi:two-component system, OmpR family, sensor kinase